MTPRFLSQHFCPVWSVQMYSLSSYCSMLSLNHLTFQNCALITTHKSNAAGSVLLQAYFHLSASYTYCSYLQGRLKIKAFTTELTLANAAHLLRHFRAPTRCSPNRWDPSLGEGEKGVCSVPRIPLQIEWMYLRKVAMRWKGYYCDRHALEETVSVSQEPSGMKRNMTDL